MKKKSSFSHYVEFCKWNNSTNNKFLYPEQLLRKEYYSPFNNLTVLFMRKRGRNQQKRLNTNYTVVQYNIYTENVS